MNGGKRRTEGLPPSSFFKRIKLTAIVITGIIIVSNFALGFLVSMDSSNTVASINPVALVPDGSNAVMHVNVDNLSLLMFEKNGSFGGIIPFGLSTLFLDRGHSIHRLNSSNIHIEKYSSYRSTNIYEVTGINLVSASRNLLQLVGAFNNKEVATDTGYISDSVGGNTVAGDLPAVEASINSSFSGGPGNAYAALNMSAGSSLVFYENSSLITMISVNSTAETTSMNVHFTNATSERTFLEAYSIMLYNFIIYPLPLKVVNNQELSLAMNMNMYGFINFISNYWGLWNRYAGGLA